MSGPRAEIGIIGGTGLYSLFDDCEEHALETPFGPPSGPLAFASVGDRRVAFLPRHGLRHEHLPHEIPYRANAWALASAGVTQILACCAVGSLREDVPPGSLVVPDQLVDRTTGRTQTFFSGRVAHIPFADPYCPDGSAAVARAAAGVDSPFTAGATMVVIDGPRFSTRAESQWYSAQGWSLINMTGHPEAVLARELALCYTTIALVTDYDAGVDAETAVTQDEIFEMFRAKLGVLSALVLAAVAELPAERSCHCTRALDGIEPAFDFAG